MGTRVTTLASRWLCRFVLLLSLLPAIGQAWQGPDLTGLWTDDAGGRYRIRQAGNTLVWYDDRSPTVLNVFVGTISASDVNGQWWDLPGGQLLGSGRLSLRIESGDRIVVTASSNDYRGTVITRVGGRDTGGGGGTGGGGASAAQSMGCFKDTGDRDLPSGYWSDPRMTVAACVSRCAQQGFAYAGLQYGNQCYCGSAYGRYGPANNCDMRCGGNPGEICGGNWANSVYRVPGIAPPPVPPAQALGCFRDTGDRDLQPDSWIDGRMTVGACLTRCAQGGYAYAGLQYGNQCYCGNAYGRFGPADNCDMRCTGSVNEICGGFWANSIYRLTGGGQPPQPPRPGSACADPRTLSVMDEWLRTANPQENSQAGWRVSYDAWGRLVGRTPSATITGLPQGVDTPMSRCDYLWSIAGRLNSTNLGTLQSYVTARLR